MGQASWSAECTDCCLMQRPCTRWDLLTAPRTRWRYDKFLSHSWGEPDQVWWGNEKQTRNNFSVLPRGKIWKKKIRTNFGKETVGQSQQSQTAIVTIIDMLWSLWFFDFCVLLEKYMDCATIHVLSPHHFRWCQQSQDDCWHHLKWWGQLYGYAGTLTTVRRHTVDIMPSVDVRVLCRNHKPGLID